TSSLHTLKLRFVAAALQANARGDRQPLTAASIDLNIEVADLLPQGIAVETEQIGRPDLVTAGGRQRGGQERQLDFPQNPMVEARRRDAVWEAREVRCEIS